MRRRDFREVPLHDLFGEQSIDAGNLSLMVAFALGKLAPIFGNQIREQGLRIHWL